MQLEGQEPRDQGKERGTDEFAAICEEAKLDLGLFSDDERPVIESLIRASRSPFSRAAVIAALLRGDDGPPFTAAVVAKAVREFTASEHPFSARHLAGFCRDAARAKAVGAQRERAVRETQHLDAEQVERENRQREEAATDEMIADFARRHGEEYETMTARAEAMVPRTYKGAYRAPMVRGALAKLIRERGSDNGTH